MNPVYASTFVMVLIGLSVLILFLVIRHQDKHQKPPASKPPSR